MSISRSGLLCSVLLLLMVPAGAHPVESGEEGEPHPHNVDESSGEEGIFEEQARSFPDAQQDARKMERLETALPGLHEAMTSGYWENMDTISRFEITSRSALTAWGGDEEAMELLADVVDRMRGVGLASVIPLEVAVESATSVIELHALTMEDGLTDEEMVSKSTVAGRAEIAPTGTEPYLECMQESKSKALQNSLDDHSDFLETLFEGFPKTSGFLGKVDFFASKWKSLQSSLEARSGQLKEDGISCLESASDNMLESELRGISKDI